MRDIVEFQPGSRVRAFRAIFAVALVVVLAASLWPQSTPPVLSTGWDKTDHLAAYCVLGLLGLASWAQRGARVLIGLLAYGAAIELLQGFVGYRDAAWQDFVANAAGLGVAQLAVSWRRRRIPR